MDKQTVGEFVDVEGEEVCADNAKGEQVPDSQECNNEDEADMEGASDSSDVVDLGKLCKKWEKYTVGHKLER